jgi:hypothetical protein
MAKQKRLGARPGQRRPLQRPTTRPSATKPAGSVTPEEEARAAELEAQILADEKAADDARKTRDRRATAGATEATIYSSAPLAERAAVEYAYVRRDLRRLTVVCLSLLGVLALIYVLFNVLNVI